MTTHFVRAALGAVGLTLGLFAGATAPAWAQEPDHRSDVRRYALNNALFVLYHEAGHMLIDQLNLPVLGREEDAADNIATYTILTKGNPDSVAMLKDVALGWRMAEPPDEGASDYFRFHRLDRDRAQHIVCLMVGYDQDGFAELAVDYGLDARRQRFCAQEFALLARTMEGLFPSSGDDAATPATIMVRYNYATGALGQTAIAIRLANVLETVADDMAVLPGLTGIVTFRSMSCNEVNAFYLAAGNQVILCYELVDKFVADGLDLFASLAGPQTPSSP